MNRTTSQHQSAIRRCHMCGCEASSFCTADSCVACNCCVKVLTQQNTFFLSLLSSIQMVRCAQQLHGWQ